mmetsp:Transcript_84547/g.266892  ORF Transcript_84547/g.266892 Transcript_84547/m.266892 type:complete len:200 (+) Transcript_84547:1724-2323(+)
MPCGLLDVRVVRLQQVHQGMRERRTGQDACHRCQAEERREKLRCRAGGATVQHRLLRPGLHARGLDGLGAVLHGLRRWPHRAHPQGPGAHPRPGEVPCEAQQEAAPGAAVQHAGLRRRRDLHSAAGPGHRAGRQRLSEVLWLQHPARLRREPHEEVRGQVLRPGRRQDGRGPLWQRPPADPAGRDHQHHACHPGAEPHV